MKRFVALYVYLMTGVALANPVTTVTVNPTSATASTSVTVTWSTSGFSTTPACTASGGWTGSKTPSGSQVITVSATTTFSLICSETAGSATVTWTAPTQRTDGTALTNLAGYQLFYTKTLSGLESAVPVAITAPASTYNVTGLSAGTWYFGMKARDSNNLLSVMSNTGSKSIVLGSASGAATITFQSLPNPPVLGTVIQYAYDTTYHHIHGLRLGKVVGTLPLNSPCFSDINLSTDYYQIDARQVTYTRAPRSSILVSKCAWQTS
jgi:hypothetical protein